MKGLLTKDFLTIKKKYGLLRVIMDIAIISTCALVGFWVLWIYELIQSFFYNSVIFGKDFHSDTSLPIGIGFCILIVSILIYVLCEKYNFYYVNNIILLLLSLIILYFFKDSILYYVTLSSESLVISKLIFIFYSIICCIYSLSVLIYYLVIGKK